MGKRKTGPTFQQQPHLHLLLHKVEALNKILFIDNLFPHESILSERIYFVLVSAKSKEGDQKTDPFRFIRKYDLLEEKYSNILSQVGEMFRNQSHNFVKAETSSSVTQSRSIEQKSCSESGTENISNIKVLEDFDFSGVAKFL